VRPATGEKVSPPIWVQSELPGRCIEASGRRSVSRRSRSGGTSPAVGRTRRSRWCRGETPGLSSWPSRRRRPSARDCRPSPRWTLKTWPADDPLNAPTLRWNSHSCASQVLAYSLKFWAKLWISHPTKPHCFPSNEATAYLSKFICFQISWVQTNFMDAWIHCRKQSTCN